MNDLKGIINVGLLQPSFIGMGLCEDVIIYVGMDRVWPPHLLTHFVTEDNIQFVAETSTDEHIQRLHYDTVYYVDDEENE